MKKVMSFGAAALFLFFFCGLSFADGDSLEGRFEEVVIATAADGKETKAAFFKAGDTHAVIGVPGMRYGMESWFFLAEHLGPHGISILALDGSDILNAIEFLRGKGYEKVSLIGSSMGGAAVLDAVNDHSLDDIAKIVVLAPYGGKPVRGPMHKLFVVSKRDMYDLHDSTVKLHNDSSEPKKIKVYTKTAAHGHEMFSSKKVNKELIAMIVGFFTS